MSTRLKQGRVWLLVLGGAITVAGCGGGTTKTVTVSQSAPTPQAKTVTVTQTETAPAATTGDGLTGPSVDTTPAATTDTTQTSGGKIADRRIGQVGGDGGMLFKVVSSTVVSSVAQSYDSPVRPVAGAKFQLVTVDVKNTGKVSVSPFCGGSGTVLIDSKDRNFKALSQVMVSIPGNSTCDDLQPGFRGTYKVLFQVPKDATISSIGFWDSNDSNDYDGSASWVRFRL